MQTGGIQALVAIINASPLKSAHPHAICVGQMAAAVALQHILMRLPHASEAIVKASRRHVAMHALLGTPVCTLPGGDDVMVMTKRIHLLRQHD